MFTFPKHRRFYDFLVNIYEHIAITVDSSLSQTQIISQRANTNSTIDNFWSRARNATWIECFILSTQRPLRTQTTTITHSRPTTTTTFKWRQQIRRGPSHDRAEPRGDVIKQRWATVPVSGDAAPTRNDPLIKYLIKNAIQFRGK